MNNAALIQRILQQAFTTQDFSTLAEHLADDVAFEVTPPGGNTTAETCGKDVVLGYFTGLGDIVSFWRVHCYGDGERVVALGAESFTIPRYGVTLGSEFAFLLHVCDGLITRFLIIENLSRSPALEETVFSTAS